MVFLSGFVEVQSTRMHRFLAEVSGASNTPAGPAAPEGFVDLGRELSCLHSLLAETLLPDQVPAVFCIHCEMDMRVPLHYFIF